MRFFIAAGQRSDYTKRPMEALIADKGYDANYISRCGKFTHAQVVIPPCSHKKVLCKYDIELYKERNPIKKMFNKLKHFRSVATRYDKLAYNGNLSFG
ncbi:hypothetical protein MIDIC_180010 [Alphaproteobacteria bacterium]